MLVIAFTLVPSTVTTAPMSVSFDFWSITTPLICCAHVGMLAAESNPNTIIPLLAFITYIVWFRLQRYGGYITLGLQWGWKALTKLRQRCYFGKSAPFFRKKALAAICFGYLCRILNLRSVGYHHAESEHIFFEVLLVDGIVLEQGTVVVYGLWRIRQDAGYLGTFLFHQVF